MMCSFVGSVTSFSVLVSCLRFCISGNALLRRLVRIGVLDENRMKLDYVLGLKIEDFLERRLETQVRNIRCRLNLISVYENGTLF